jgi:hypothetical protein
MPTAVPHSNMTASLPDRVETSTRRTSLAVFALRNWSRISLMACVCSNPAAIPSTKARPIGASG